MSRTYLIRTVLLVLICPLLIGCGQKLKTQSAQPVKNHRLKVVTTTSIVGDVVSNIGGENIELSVLLPPGTDPHSFDPTPQDIASVAEADVVFANGAGLEEFLIPLIESAGAEHKLVSVSEGIDFLDYTDKYRQGVNQDEENSYEEGGEAFRVGSVDPHTWMDPDNVEIWVKNIESELSDLDPENSAIFQANAEGYRTELRELETWITDQVAKIPEDNRELVTDHTIFSYFLSKYGFEQVGALIPGYSSLAEPTARDLADIENSISELDVKAVFVGNTINPALAERVAEDTGVNLVFLFTGSLSEPGGEAESYLEYMRFNVNAIVEGLLD